MKRFIILVVTIFCLGIFIYAERSFSESAEATNVHYRLFPTENMWTFLKLDTATGEVWQVQFSVDGDDYRFETVLSSVDLTEKFNQDEVVGRYTLYPTSNIYNFVMLDQIDGYTYQVQWGMKEENRGIVPISE